MLPDFLIIGAQKSASTFLQYCLQEHPEIYMPIGETPFFETPDYENSELSTLEKLYEKNENKKFGLKRPNYLSKPEVPDRIAKHLPESKLIVVLRNPIDRAKSAYYHNVKYGFIPPLDFDLGIEKIIKDSRYNEKYKRAREIIDFGFYANSIKRYQYFIDKGNFLILFHEDIIKDPVRNIKKLYDYVGVDSNYLPRSLNKKPQKVIYNIHRLRFNTLKNNLIYDYNEDFTRLEKKKKNIFETLLYAIIVGVDKAFLSQIFKNENKQIGEQVKSMLVEIYDEDIRELEALLNKNLDSWLV